MYFNEGRQKRGKVRPLTQWVLGMGLVLFGEMGGEKVDARKADIPFAKGKVELFVLNF
jgi:hypothetical protein